MYEIVSQVLQMIREVNAVQKSEEEYHFFWNNSNTEMKKDDFLGNLVDIIFTGRTVHNTS